MKEKSRILSSKNMAFRSHVVKGRLNVENVVVLSMQQVGSTSVMRLLQESEWMRKKKEANKETLLTHQHTLIKAMQQVREAKEGKLGATLFVVGVRNPVEHGLGIFLRRRKWRGFSPFQVSYIDRYIYYPNDDLENMVKAFVQSGICYTCPNFLDYVNQYLFPGILTLVSKTFDRRKGWALYRMIKKPKQKNASDILVCFYQQERFDRFFDDFLQPAFGTPERALKENTLQNLEEWQQMVEAIKKDGRSGCEEVYSADCLGYFYDAKELEAMKSKWA